MSSGLHERYGHSASSPLLGRGRPSNLFSPRLAYTLSHVNRMSAADSQQQHQHQHAHAHAAAADGHSHAHHALPTTVPGTPKQHTAAGTALSSSVPVPISAPLLAPSSVPSHLSSSSSQPSAAAAAARAGYILGLVYLGLVILLWVLSSALIQWIFEQQGDAQPFFLTYFCTSLFTLYLPTFYALQACRRTAVYQRIAPDSAMLSAPASSPLLPLRDHLHFAFLLSPIWFLMEYLYNESLSLTTLSQNTILSTTSGVFVLTFNWMIFRDPLTLTNALGVLFTFAGAYLVYHDGTVAQEEAVQAKSGAAGDVLAVMAAVFYGLYTVTVKFKVKDDSAVNWQLILGFLGLTNLALAWPFFFLLHWTRLEPFALPSSTILLSLLLNGLLGTVVADYLWARSILLTSPLVATMGLTLNIPCSLLVEWLWKGRGYGWTYVVGGLSVVVGFVLVNWREVELKKVKVEEEDRAAADHDDNDHTDHTATDDLADADSDLDLGHSDDSHDDHHHAVDRLDALSSSRVNGRTGPEDGQVSKADLQDEFRFVIRPPFDYTAHQ